MSGIWQACILEKAHPAAGAFNSLSRQLYAEQSTPLPDLDYWALLDPEALNESLRASIQEVDIRYRLLQAHQSGYRTWLPTTYLEEGKRWI
jgi:hypothetical protein